jgi:hypothetical protein
LRTYNDFKVLPKFFPDCRAHKILHKLCLSSA